jgi:hypothetical protein
MMPRVIGLPTPFLLLNLHPAKLHVLFDCPKSCYSWAYLLHTHR